MSHEDDPPAPDVVDFDALHAALGELPPPPTSSSPSVGESQGRSSATYSSARPHTIPPTRAPVLDDMNAPAVIVQTEDTAPTGPPKQMTVPMAGAPPYGGAVGAGGRPMARPPTPTRPFTAEPFAGPVGSAVPAPLPDNVRTPPMALPRRPRTPTIVVRTRGPTKQQKLLVFIAMLLVFVGGGIAFLIFGKQLGLGIGLDLDLEAPPRPSTVSPAAPPAADEPTPAPNASAAGPLAAAGSSVPVGTSVASGPSVAAGPSVTGSPAAGTIANGAGSSGVRSAAGVAPTSAGAAAPGSLPASSPAPKKAPRRPAPPVPPAP